MAMSVNFRGKKEKKPKPYLDHLLIHGSLNFQST